MIKYDMYAYMWRDGKSSRKKRKDKKKQERSTNQPYDR